MTAPGSTLVARHELDSLFHVRTLSERASLLIWDFVSPASLRGERTPISSSALMPGRSTGSSSALVPSAITGYPRLSASAATAPKTALLHT